MKRLVPSTAGTLTVSVKTKQGQSVSPARFAKFASVREIANAFIGDWDTLDNPVTSTTIIYTFPVERT